MRNFDDLSEREILALAISNEEEDARIYADFADGLHEDYPASAKVFDEMAAEENDAPAPAHRSLRVEIRRAHPARPPPGHPRLYSAETGLADEAARPRSGARAHSRHGARRGALLPSGRDPHDRRVDPQAARRPRRGRGQARSARRRTSSSRC